MFSWICLICIALLVGKIMCFFSASTIMQLYDDKPAKSKRTRRARKSSAPAAQGYAATGTYGSTYAADYIKAKRSI